jgi:uncharacterized protein
MDMLKNATSVNSEQQLSGLALQERARALSAILSFFALAFTWSWVLGFSASYRRPNVPVFSAILNIASGLGPSIAAFITIGFFGGTTGLIAWLKNSLDWGVGWHWYALAFFTPPLAMLFALAIHWALGGAIPTSPAVGHIPLAIANFGFVFLIGGPLGEEFGWRSYAQPALNAKMGWRTASLIIGIIWGLWHLPWFFTAGTAQSHMPFITFMLNIIAGSVLFSWLFMKSNGSVIPVLIAHTSLNAFAGILSIIPSAETGRPYALVTGILVVIAGYILLLPDTNTGQGIHSKGTE